MGYFVKGKEIAKLNPKAVQVSLSANPNFVQFESNSTESVPNPLEVSFTLKPDRGYKFEDVQLPASEDEVVLSKDITLDEMIEFIKKNEKLGKRINPYTTYFRDGYDGTHYRLVNYTRFSIRDDRTEIDRWFQGIDAAMEASGMYETSDYTYRLTDSPLETAQNLREALLLCPFIRDNFKVSLSASILGDSSEKSIELGTTIRLVALGVGRRYNFDIKLSDDNYKTDFMNLIEISGTDRKTSNPDSINEGTEACEIQLDIYSDTGILLGQDDGPDMDDLGMYRTTLSKSYYNSPLWFDVNTMQTERYHPPFVTNTEGVGKHPFGVWFDAGTVSDRRFVAKRVTRNLSESFYYSPVLYTLTGGVRNLDVNDLSDYVVSLSDLVQTATKPARPLTNQPIISHVKGQTQHFNFILSDSRTADSIATIALEYELLTQSGVPIGRFVEHERRCSELPIVNTIIPDIDRFIDLYPNVGTINLRLVSGEKVLTDPQIYNILPADLFRVNDFVFLNALGGWSSFNFGDQTQHDFKATASTYFQNQTPAGSRYSSIETVYKKVTDEKFIVRTMPVSLDTADWLKEIASSIAVYEQQTCRYVIVDELNVKYTNNDSFVRLEMKYHYSDSMSGQTA